ncbi:MAG: hypothetical protein ABI593_01850 [Betaproteobacteria bacterium]
MSILKGQDANWDLQNYHFYGPWAWWNGRLAATDIAAAQLQTYHNPALDLPFYAMVAQDWPPRLIAFALAIPAGVGAFVLGKIVALLFPGDVRGRRALLPIFAFAIGITGAVGRGVVGTTMNEWPAALLVLVALWLLLRAMVAAPGAMIPATPIIIAGLACGIGSGLKLTVATFAMGLGIALLCRRPLRDAWRHGMREAMLFGAGVAGGLAVAIGSWSWALWSQFGNPLFPYLNQWFGSPWWYDVSVSARAYGPHEFSGWLTFPYVLFRPSVFFVAEVTYRDARIPILCTLALAALAFALVARTMLSAARQRSRDARVPAASWRFVGIFWLVSFVLWAAQFSIYRYLLPLELLTGALIVGLLRMLLPSGALPAAVTIVAVAIIGTTRWADWGHVEFAPRWFDVRMPDVAPDALVLLASDAPLAYLLPFMPASARHMGAYNNINRPESTTRLASEMANTIREHAGPLYSLAHDERMAATVYAAHGLAPVPGSCARVLTNIGTDVVRLCRLERRPAQ